MNKKKAQLNSNQSWFQRNKDKTVNDLVDKSFLTDSAEVLLKSGYLQHIAKPSKTFLDGLNIQVDATEVLTEESFYRIFLPLMNNEENQEDAIKAFTDNRLFRKFMSDLLYDNIRAFWLDKNMLKQVPIAGRVVSASQNISKKAGERFSDISNTIERRIKKFIELNIGAVTNFTVNYARKSITPGTTESVLKFLWEHLQEQKISIKLNFNTQSNDDLDAEAVILHVLDALIDALLDKYGDRKIGELSILG